MFTFCLFIAVVCFGGVTFSLFTSDVSRGMFVFMYLFPVNGVNCNFRLLFQNHLYLYRHLRLMMNTKTLSGHVKLQYFSRALKGFNLLSLRIDIV